MENEVNVNVNANEQQNPATPEVELTSTAPETPENVSIVNNNNSFPELSASDLEKLSPVEQDLYLDAKEMNPAEIAVMPPDVRKDIENLRNKLTAQATVDDAPESEVKEADVTPTVTEESSTAPEVSTVSADDTIKRLSGEVNHWKAKYNTLQGKYNAEIKNVNKATAPKEEPDAGKSDDAEEESSLDADIVNEIRRIARKEFASGNNTPAVDPEMASKVNDLYSDRQKSIFDAKIRHKCGNGIGFAEVDQHPLFNSFAREMYDGNRVTADVALEEAIAKGDYESAAGIIAEVVNVMQNNHMWDISGRHTGNAQAVPANVPQVVPAAVTEPVPKSPVAPAVKPSAVVPHNVSGVTNSSLHTVRTAAQAKQEYAALHKRFLGGDSTVLPRMNQLDDEITRLEIKEKFK